ncbi:MAG: UDP-N-acetylmuramoyl-tripeptide--D-alanyl-D-alanine ligase [Actinomycetota bacterium]
MQFQLSSLAAAIGAGHHGPDATVAGVSIDSRTVEDGNLFVPIVAERDGHDFIASAVAGGAAAVLSARPATTLGLDDVPVLEVDDTGRALTDLGRVARSRLSGPVIGITGSVGKTSVKDLTLAACGGADPGRRVAWASAASFNNELGVPLTLANAPDDVAVTIVEMGARGVGHIAELCRVAAPTIGVVTAVALAHSELFGSIEAVAEGKGELVEALPADGVAVLNADDPRVAAMAGRTTARVLTYGSAEADVRVGPISLDRLLRPTVTLTAGGRSAEVTLQARGVHMAANAGAALAAALAAEVPFEDAVAGLAAADVSRWRMEVDAAADGLLVINDAYNANPTSMRAALSSLAAIEVDRRVAVLGAMAELGEEGPAEHRAVAAEAASAGIDVIAVDAAEYGDHARHVADRDAALALVAELGAGAAVLVKGSRVAGLELVAEALLTR